MGMDAEVLAVGPYHPNIAHCLEYDPEWYAKVPEGARVLTEFFHCVTSDSSRDLAKVLGCDENDPSTWHFTDISEIDLQELIEVASRSSEGAATEAEHFRLLAASGFEFFYRPNH